MPIAHAVYPLHICSKEFSMRRGVAELVITDIIVNHLVENGVFHHIFRQIDTGIDIQREIRIATRAVGV